MCCASVIFSCMVIYLIGQVRNQGLADDFGRYGSPVLSPSPATNVSAGFAYGNFVSLINATGDDTSTVGQFQIITDVGSNSSSVRLGSDQRSGFTGRGNSSIGVRGLASSRFGNNFAGLNIFGSDTRTSNQNDTTTVSSIISDALVFTRPGFSAQNFSICVGPQCAPTPTPTP